MRRSLFAVLLALLAVPASAHAGFFPAEVIAGPSPDLMKIGDLDIARDGQGGVVYTQREAGVPHVFFSRFVDGAFQPGVRVDQGLAGTSSQPVIGASDNNRLAIAYVNEGNLYTTVKPKDATGFTAPAQVAAGGVSSPSIDVSINGATYVSWTQGGDVRVARADRDNPAFRVLDAPVDVTGGAAAGDSERKASQIDVSADGTAVVVWGEDGTDGRTHVYARRLFELRLSTAPQDLTLPDVGGVPATGADTPRIDMEDDSSYAQVTFRQNTAGGPRLVMRRLVGSTFDPPVVIDNNIPGDTANLELTGRGEGLLAVGGAGGEVAGSTIFNNKITGTAKLNEGNGVTSGAVAAVGENEDGTVAWFQGNADSSIVKARYFDGVEFVKLTDDGTLTRPEFGGAYPAGGIEAAADRAGDVAVVFMQGGEADRRIVAGLYDKPPTRVTASNTQKKHKFTRFAWRTSLNLFGGTKYTVLLNGKPIGETNALELAPQPGSVPDGEHRWQVQIADRRGQVVVSRSRILRVDNTPPTVTFSVKRSKRKVTVSAKGGDPNGNSPSGLGRLLVDWGDGKLLPFTSKISKTFGRSGTYKIRVKAIDKATNEAIAERSVRVTNK
jgi:hypothetical protein